MVITTEAGCADGAHRQKSAAGLAFLVGREQREQAVEPGIGKGRMQGERTACVLVRCRPQGKDGGSLIHDVGMLGKAEGLAVPETVGARHLVDGVMGNA